MVLALASAPALANGVPAALKKSHLDLMPWPAHIKLHDGRLALTPQFDIRVTGHPGQRVYNGATRLLHHLQRRTGIVFKQHVVTATSDDPHVVKIRCRVEIERDSLP